MPVRPAPDAGRKKAALRRLLCNRRSDYFFIASLAASAAFLAASPAAPAASLAAAVASLAAAVASFAASLAASTAEPAAEAAAVAAPAAAEAAPTAPAAAAEAASLAASTAGATAAAGAGAGAGAGSSFLPQAARAAAAIRVASTSDFFISSFLNGRGREKTISGKCLGNRVARTERKHSSSFVQPHIIARVYSALANPERDIA